MASPHQATPNGRRARSAARANDGVAWERYRDNTARHLIGIARDMQQRVMHALTTHQGYRGLRPSFSGPVSLLWRGPRSLGGLANELAISKQACSQLVAHLEREAYVSSEPDPRDGRRRLVALAPRGRKLASDAVHGIAECEQAYTALIGPDDQRAFVDALERLFVGLGLASEQEAGFVEAARSTLGVLPLIADRIQQRLMEATTACGHRGLKMSHGQILPLVGPGGARLHQLARTQRISRQAIHATARDLEGLGYLSRSDDPIDRRGVVLHLTRSGERLLRDSVAALDDLDAAFRATLGVRRSQRLERIARDLYRALHLEEDIFGSERDEADPLAGLADQLRRELGQRDAARLAQLLESAD